MWQTGKNTMATARTLFFADCTGAFQGGGCRAAAFAGAYEAAYSAGVHFASVVGTSAGAIMAALVGAGATPEQVTRILRSLRFSDLLRKPDGRPASRVAAMLPPWPSPVRQLGQFLMYGGIYSSVAIEEWVESSLSELLPSQRQPIRFRDLHLPTWVVATDLLTGQLREWSTEHTPEEPVAHAVRASCSIPFFFQPVDGRYVDGGALSNLPTVVVADDLDRSARRVLAFSLYGSESTGSTPLSPMATVSALADAVVSGAQDIQLRLQPKVHVVRINTGTVRATDFDSIDEETVGWLIDQGRNRTENFLTAERMEVIPGRVLERAEDHFQTLSELADLMLAARERIILSHHDTAWVYELFPALLNAVLRRVKVQAIVPKHHTFVGSNKEVYRRGLLSKMGAQVIELDQVGPRAYLIDPDNELRATAIVPTQLDQVDSVVYRAIDGHESVLHLLRESLGIASGEGQGEQPVPQLEAAAPEAVIQALRSVPQYAEAKLTFEEVPLAQVDTYAKYAPEFKYRQVERITRTFREGELPPFGPVAVRFQSGGRSLFVPPVFERAGERFLIINGTTRSLFAMREGSKTIAGVVASDVTAEPPARNPRPLSRVGVEVGRATTSHRFDDLNYSQFRHIERAVHTVESLQ
jgi:predicted acylesterase/phospholipase RssA